MSEVGVSLAMPRGGGHFGGHHHGGGHHHRGGGGWGHHHRHYRPYRGGVVFTGWWYPGYYSGRRAYVGYGIWWIIFFVIILAIILTASLTTVNDNDNDSDNKGYDTEYAPLESRLIDVSQTFCSSIEVKNPSGQMPATAYVLTRGPSLTREHNYVINDTLPVGPNSYHFWNYYLHRGSFMNASICVQSGQGGEFYIIRGSKDFQDWQDGYDKYVKFIDVGLPCPQTMSVNFHVDGPDDYFFAYASLSGTVTLRTSMHFYRKEYEIVLQDVKDSCSAGGVNSGKCTVSVPYGGKYYFVLATGNTTSSDGDEDGAAVSWSCQGRVWVYLLAFFLPALFVITIISVICVVCCMRQRRRNHSYGSLGDDAATAAAITNASMVVTTTTATSSEPLKDAPPPYNPATVPQPGYGGQPTAAPYSQLPYPVAAPYPPPAMPQPPPAAQNYGATDSKPL